MGIEISADVGGTFTDFVVRDPDAGIGLYKSSTTPGRIADGIFEGLNLIASRRRVGLRSLLTGCDSLAIGTTVATNAILEGKAAKTGLICTAGFRDTLLIREGGKADTYNIFVDYPAPYIPRYLSFGVPERINAEGGVETRLDEAAVHAAIAQMKGWKVEAVAVALIWSIANPAHEVRIGEILAEIWPDVPFSLSHRVSPTLREYRRFSATAIDASLKPVVQRNIAEIEARLADDGFAGTLTFVTSNGGRTSTREVLAKPVYLCLSGPSAAPHAGVTLARAEGVDDGNVLTIDMGGTSFDVAIATGWEIPMHREGLIGGHMFGVPSVDVRTIGAGGGSIARVDAGGFVHVGPESAGARPGPACYGRGGTRPTVTDANLVRGLLDPKGFADGQMELSEAAAAAAIKQHVADPLGMSIEEAASLIALTVEQNMVGAIENLTIRRGVDPRGYLLVSGGSAAGLHAAVIARELGMRRALVPDVAGVLSAYGIATGDIRFGFARGLYANSARFDLDAVNAVLADLTEEGTSYLDRMRVPAARRSLLYTTEARYAGQVWQLTLRLPGPRIEAGPGLAALVEAFHALHEQVYAVRANDPVEFTEWNLMAVGHVAHAATEAVRPEPARETAPGVRRVFLKEIGGYSEIPLFDGATLRTGSTISGPALVQTRLTVALVPPSCQAHVTARGGLMIEVG
ncbi:MAG: hydantoinase/oxoprolinase family protein [Acetobacteraceae bacterium]